MQTLDEILAKYPDTDKNSIHSYSGVYEQLFSPMRESAKSVLEVGVRFGGSLMTWAEYFPNSSVIGVDNGEEAGFWKSPTDRIRVCYGDSTKPETLHLLGAANNRFDLILDDGNHSNLVQVATFAALRPFLRQGGIYVIEDVENVTYATDIARLFGGRVVDLRNKKNRHDDILVIFGYRGELRY